MNTYRLHLTTGDKVTVRSEQDLVAMFTSDDEEAVGWITGEVPDWILDGRGGMVNSMHIVRVEKQA